MNEIVIQTIQEITAEKQKAKRLPHFALRIEILKRIWQKADSALSELAENRTLKTGNTLNDKYFEL